ncbi:hypothetical protein B0G84_6516 [Paraburkholderia sp. BL8N3]|jgi:hypothetical protein|nr:hypothetical protein [Paraburkholderia sp. BL8N3]TCK34558.1 hypothetical protein B0G84_6516 [Paraburkholderia sp. BL8N3]
MEHLVRVYNERDRATLAWLRRQVGDAELTAAACACTGASKPYLSRVCRRLGVTPPPFAASAGFAPTAVGEDSLAAIRLLLAERTGAPRPGRTSAVPRVDGRL